MVRSGNDGNFCAVNPKFLAIVADIAFVVIPVSQVSFYIFLLNILWFLKNCLLTFRRVASTSKYAK